MQTQQQGYLYVSKVIYISQSAVIQFPKLMDPKLM